MGRLIEDIIQGRSRTPAAFLFRAVMLPLSFIYGTAVFIRNMLYSTGIFKSEKLDKPVISIGNLTVGGTGKTPLAMLIAGKLIKEGKKPALLARGYGSSSEKLNDELEMAGQTLPGLKIYQGADRRTAGKKAIEEGADCIILDDGFQHRKVKRDCNILVVDSRSLKPMKLLIPAGPWRETWSSRKRADITVFTKSSHTDDQLPSSGTGEEFHAVHKADSLLINHEYHPLSMLRDKKAVLFCGIGDPGYFRETVEKTGILPAALISFPDHHAYTEEDITRIEKRCMEEEVLYALTTEKDMVKVEKLLKKTKNNIEFIALSVKMAFLQNTEGFFRSVSDRTFGKR